MKKILKKISALIQTSTESFKRHNRQYEETGKLEKERIAGLENLNTDLLNCPEMKTRDLLNKYSHVNTAVDVGSGTGWSAAALSPLVDRVIGIEPSKAAIEISRQIYIPDKYPNIEWLNGLAENKLPELNLSEPTLFLTGCVLSHIRDKEVTKICVAINDAAPEGSILSFAECWGEEPWHQIMWHVRTKDWWQSQLTGWELTFHGPPVPNENYNKGIWGVKIK